MLQKRLPTLNTKIRDALGKNLLGALEKATPGSTARFRGSLARGTADQYSDIDIAWIIPDDRFSSSLSRLPAILSALQAVESLREAPDFQNSDKRRLVFIQFKDLPLFWRVDLEIFSQSIQGNQDYDVGNPSAKGDQWSLTHSALMNAVAAIKALGRNSPTEATQVIVRGYHRVGLEVPQDDPQILIIDLAEKIAAMDLTLSNLSERVKVLCDQVMNSRNDLLLGKGKR